MEERADIVFVDDFNGDAVYVALPLSVGDDVVDAVIVALTVPERLTRMFEAEVTAEPVLSAEDVDIAEDEFKDETVAE